MTHQRNLILSAAVAAAFGFSAMSAHAGVASALPAKIATAALKNNAQGFQGNQVTYSTQVPLSNNTIYYVYIKLTNGVFSAVPNPGLWTSSNANLQTELQASTGALSTDGTFAVYTLLPTASVVPVNTTMSFTPSGTAAAAGGASGLTALLGGGAVNAVISIGSSASTTTPLADIDSAAGGNIITFTAPEAYFGDSSGDSAANFTKLNVAAGGLAPETVQINVSGGSGVGTTLPVFTPAGTVDFGGFVVTDIPGVLNAFQTNSWNIADEYSAGSLAATVTGNFAAAAAMYMSSTASCANSVNSLTLNAAKTQATVAAGTLIASGFGQVVCMVVNGTTVIPPTQPTINITLSTSANAVEAGAPLSFGPTTLYNLTPNGGFVVIRSYIPAAAGGWTDVVRIINTGSVAAPISVARIDPTTGVTGTTAVLPGGPLAAGAAINYTAQTIETALGGAFAAGDRPRLIFTAPGFIEGQNYIVNPNSTITTLHGRDGPAGAP